MISILNIEFFQLIISMFLSHVILGTPLYGAAVYLFAHNLILSQKDIVKSTLDNRKGIPLQILIIISLVCGFALILFYPSIIQHPRLNQAILLIILMIAKDVTCDYYQRKISKWNWKSIIGIILILSAYLTSMIWGASRVMSGDNFIIAIVFFVLSSIFTVSKRSHEYIKVEQEKFKISSYKIFKNMQFYSQLSLYTGILLYIAFLSFQDVRNTYTTYFYMTGWLIAVAFIFFIIQRSIKSNSKINISMFILGAIAWIGSIIEIFHSNTQFHTIIMTCLMAFGLSFINGSIVQMNNDFQMVMKLIHADHIEDRFKLHDMQIQNLSLLTSGSILLIIFTIWCFIMPEFQIENVETLFGGSIIQIPIVFMVLSIYFALNQPLDAKLTEKLSHYLTVGSDKNTKQNLVSLLVKKYRVRYGVKIIATFVRPFLHLKVIGRENIDENNYPSVFVCNHGIFYGPIAAVLYLPTYFRPWIHLKMLDIDQASNEMYHRFIYRIPWFGKKFKMKLARGLAQPVTWALKSFNPIGVERDSLRNMMNTFNQTIQALKESDNILLFPERPKKVVIDGQETLKHTTDTVGEMFTGFATLGSMYWSECGKPLYFYPIYSDKKAHFFNIGQPIIFDPENHPKLEKTRIADELKKAMVELSQPILKTKKES